MRTWIFQANPDRYDVLDDLARGRPITTWSVTRHVKDLSPGDRAVLWVAGRRRPGVYATGRVTGEPFGGYATESGWRRPEDQHATMTFCPLIFDCVLEDPIERDELRSDRRFQRSRIITQPQAGNPFLVTDDEWQAIADRLQTQASTPVRSGDNVWNEVQEKARLWQAENVPVYTLRKDVRNFITGVTGTTIERRSDHGRTAQHTAVTKRDILSLWDSLIADGDTRSHRGNPLYFAYALLQRAVGGIGFEPDPFRLVFTDREEALRPFTSLSRESGEVLVAGARLGRRPGGGGEGPIHAALKELVKTDPVATLGERLTFESEDLTERLGAEVPFITGDRVDLLMKDERGRYVVIEIEPRIGPADHVGFHQAAKYWVLVAVSKGIDVNRVRRVVVATEIDPSLRNHYRRLYGIESFEVSLP